MSPTATTTDLVALAALPLGLRWPHLAELRRCAAHPDPDVRALAVAGLADATGTGAFTALVAALDDEAGAVRAAAVEALRRSCRTEPGRWVHAAFHPRVDVRRLAIRGVPPPGTESCALYLATDPEIGPLPPLTADADAVCALLALVSSGAVPAAEARAQLRGVDWGAVTLDHDDWRSVLALFWDPGCEPHERASLFGALAAASDVGWFDAAVGVAGERHTWHPAAIEAVVRRRPGVLADEQIPIGVRREGAQTLLHGAPTLSDGLVVALARQVWEQGQDPERLIGALSFARLPSRLLSRVVTTNQLLAGFARDPDGFAPLLALRRVLTNQRRDRLHRTLGTRLAALLAGLLGRIPAERTSVFGRLGPHGQAVYREMLVQGVPLSPVVAEAARWLCAGMSPAQHPALVHLWLRTAHPERVGIGVAVFHHLRAGQPELVAALVERLPPPARRRLDIALAWHPPGVRAPAAFSVQALTPTHVGRIIGARGPTDALEPALAAPSQNLAFALAGRSGALGLDAALALLGSHDPPRVVHAQLERALGHDPTAPEQLDALARDHWHRADLPMLGRAWLAEDPTHAEALCRSLLADRRGFGPALAELLTLGRVSRRARRAVIGALARWEEEAPARFAQAMAGGAAECLRPRSPGAIRSPADAGLDEGELVESALLAGPAVVPEAELAALLRSGPALERLLREGRDEDVARALVKRLTTSADRSDALRRLATAFAWGVRLGDSLRGQRFTFHLLGDSALGYTRLGTTDIHVSAIAMLRGERGGRDRLEALILHELGHHLYHAGPVAEAAWRQADRERLGPLLNLVADEHLERRLRARDHRFGDRLKRLAAHAFHHGQRDFDGLALLRALGPNAGRVLVRSPLEVSRRPGHVRVRTGSLLRAMDQAGERFGRLARALRMGLGDRDGDPTVTAALGPFGRGFKDLDLAGLLDVARELARRFGRAAGLARCVGGYEQDVVAPRDAIVAGRGLDDADLQREVCRILRIPPPAPPLAGGQALNVGAEAAVGTLARERAVELRTAHAALARQVLPASEALRRQLEAVGLGTEASRGRVAGRRLDRGRLVALAAYGEPRVRIAPEPIQDDDLFLGLAIDCSGSMCGERFDRARAFGVLVAEAARGLPAIDVRFFGFDDTAVTDAGTADQCAVAGLVCGGGNDDAAALIRVAEAARASGRVRRVVVMVSDGSPTHCSVATLTGVVRDLTRSGMVCVQVAVAPLPTSCFSEWVRLDQGTLGQAATRFGTLIGRLTAQS